VPGNLESRGAPEINAFSRNGFSAAQCSDVFRTAGPISEIGDKEVFTVVGLYDVAGVQIGDGLRPDQLEVRPAGQNLAVESRPACRTTVVLDYPPLSGRKAAKKAIRVRA
jgi:hypothetical protein